MTAPGESTIRDQFLQGMSCAANTVNVVTTDGVAGRAGVTVSAMASVSADGDAPTMLVCVHHKSSTANTIIENGCFCANILRNDQSYISDTFAGRLKTEDGDKFSCANWKAMRTSSPRVKDPLTAFDCRVISSERVGTHHVFIGEVQEIFVADGGSPLIFANRAYGSPVKISPSRQRSSGTDKLRVGCFSTFGPYLLPSVLRKLEGDIGRVDLDLHEGDQRHLLEMLRDKTIDLAFVYEYDSEVGADIHAVPVVDVAPYALLPENDPLSQKTEVSLSELVKKPMVLLDAPPSRDYFLSLFDGIGEPDIAYTASTFEMVRGLVGHGLGYSLLCTKPASSMSYDGKALAIRPLSNQVPSSRLVLARRRDNEIPKIAETFIRHCIDVFRLEQ